MTKKSSTGSDISSVITVGIAGYGLSGSVFHGPFLKAHPGFKVKRIVSSRKEALIDFPDAQINVDFLALVQDPEIDLVVICTPHFLHFQQASTAMKAGKHVVIEKPVSTKSTEIEQLIQISRETGMLLFPYHNRRWDSDFLTVRKLIESNTLGRIHTFESRMERYNPLIKRAVWRFNPDDGGGTLFDLGPHLVDQALDLFGQPKAVLAILSDQRGSGTNDAFDITLLYPSLNVRLKASLLCMDPVLRYIIHGTDGSFLKPGFDMQESRLRAGGSPADTGFGDEPDAWSGKLVTMKEKKLFEKLIPSMAGNYMYFYDNVFSCLTLGEKPEISPKNALLNVIILETALKSHEEGRMIELEI
jgi:scyllo-inositol 2-dehydrogenase (NADP+)